MQDYWACREALKSDFWGSLTDESVADSGAAGPQESGIGARMLAPKRSRNVLPDPVWGAGAPQGVNIRRPELGVYFIYGLLINLYGPSQVNLHLGLIPYTLPWHCEINIQGQALKSTLPGA